MRRRWPEHCCPERHREDAAAQRALRGPSDASTHRNAAAGISQLSYSAARRVVSRVLGFRARRGVRDGRRTRGVGAIFFSVLFFGLQTAPNRHKGNPARAPAGPTLRPFPLVRTGRSPPRASAGGGPAREIRIPIVSAAHRWSPAAGVSTPGRRVQPRIAPHAGNSHARRFACRFVMCGKPADRVARSRSGRHEHTRTHANSHKGNAPRRRRRRRAYERFVSATPRGHRARADTNTPRRGRAGQPRRLGT